MSSKRCAMNYLETEDYEKTFDATEEVPSIDGDILESASILSGVMEREPDSQTEAPPKRKRQKLTHLTEEEKMQRRKLKNRYEWALVRGISTIVGLFF